MERERDNIADDFGDVTAPSICLVYVTEDDESVHVSHTLVFRQRTNFPFPIDSRSYHPQHPIKPIFCAFTPQLLINDHICFSSYRICDQSGSQEM